MRTRIIWDKTTIRDIYNRMKKRTLQEELERIHGITYGEESVKEGFLDFLLGKTKDKGTQKKIDEPGKADLVSNDVQDFYDTIQKSIENGGLKEQSLGSMTYQKEVESMQIGLMLLGYDLPKHGVDGLFGPETANSVQKFATDNDINITSENPIKESVIKIKLSLLEAALNSPLDKTSVNSGFGPRGGGSHNGVDLAANAAEVKSPADGIVEVGEIKNDDCGGTIIINHAGGFKTGYCHMQKINVKAGQKVKQGEVLGISGGDSSDVGHGRSDGRHLHFTLRKDGQLVNPLDYINKSGIVMTGGMQQFSRGLNVNATPKLLTKLLELLKQKGITSKELNQYIDKVVTGGGAQFTDLDLTKSEDFEKYSKICQKFIDTRKPNLLNITGAMMAIGAKQAFDKYQKFVPAELALAQLATEGGIGNNNPNSRPIKTRNPFNVGNTDNGTDVVHGDVQSGINTYYNLIANRYLGKGKTANDLVSNFVNHSGLRYAGPDYEKSVNSIASQANKIAQTVI